MVGGSRGRGMVGWGHQSSHRVFLRLRMFSVRGPRCSLGRPLWLLWTCCVGAAQRSSAAVAQRAQSLHASCALGSPSSPIPFLPKVKIPFLSLFQLFPAHLRDMYIYIYISVIRNLYVCISVNIYTSPGRSGRQCTFAHPRSTTKICRCVRLVDVRPLGPTCVRRHQHP